MTAARPKVVCCVAVLALLFFLSSSFLFALFFQLFLLLLHCNPTMRYVSKRMDYCVFLLSTKEDWFKMAQRLHTVCMFANVEKVR